MMKTMLILMPATLTDPHRAPDAPIIMTVTARMLIATTATENTENANAKGKNVSAKNGNVKSGSVRTVKERSESAKKGIEVATIDALGIDQPRPLLSDIHRTKFQSKVPPHCRVISKADMELVPTPRHSGADRMDSLYQMVPTCEAVI
jgi:hypothetical protein